MKKLFLFALSFAVVTVSAFSADCPPSGAVLEGTSVVLKDAVNAKISDAAWKCSEKGGDILATLSGKVKAGALFPASIKDSFFDMNYSTIEETQLTGSANTYYAKYISKMSDAAKKESGYENKMLLGSEKYYNIMVILDNAAVGSNVNAEFVINGGKARVTSVKADKLFMYGETEKDFNRLLSEKR